MTAALETRPEPPTGRPLPLAQPVHTTLPLAARYFAAAGIFLVAGAAGLVWIAPTLAAGQYLAPHVAGIAHLFTLGWITLTIFGAMSQIAPMALGAPLRSVRTGHVAFWLLAPSIAVFATGVALSSAPLTALGVTGVAVGIAVNVGIFWSALSRARHRDVSWASLVIGLAFLSSTLVLGLVLAHNLHTGWIAGARIRVLAAHLHVALIGWALIVIVGMSSRMLPMFLIVRGVRDRWTRPALALLAIGVPVLATGLAVPSGPLEWSGATLVESGVAAFLWQTSLLFRKRERRPLDAGMRLAASGLGFIGLAALLGPAALVRGLTAPGLATAYLTAGLVGGIVLYVAGHYYRVVSMLAWTMRFAGRAGRGPVRTAGDLYSNRLVEVQTALMAGGVAILLAGIASGLSVLARSGALLFLAGTLIMAWQVVWLIRAALGGVRGGPDSETSRGGDHPVNGV